MDFVFEAFTRVIGFLVREIIVGIIFHFIFFNLGRAILLVLTIGRYPRGKISEIDQSRGHPITCRFGAPLNLFIRARYG